jgi:hypothetical protein
VENLKALLTSNIDLFWAAVISASISIIVSFFFRMREVRGTLELNYEFEQRQKFKNAIGAHHGRMVAAASRLSHRLWNLHNHQQRGWQVAARPASESGYYFKTTLKRLLDFYSVVLEVEESAIQLDARYADPIDFAFLNYNSALQSIVSDVRIGKGLEYDINREFDHLFSDNLRETVLRYRLTYSKETGEQSLNAFLDDPRNQSVILFLDGIRKGEGRIRWDRLVCLHLLLIGFLDTFGYPRHKNKQDSFDNLAGHAENSVVISNFSRGLQYTDLDDTASLGKIKAAAQYLNSRQMETGRTSQK